MKKIKLLFILLTILSMSATAFSKGFTPPADSNAVIYFVRVTSYAGAVSFEYFHNDEFIGIFKGKNYMRYECPAGKNLLWASSENKEFLQCDFKSGETYVVLVNVDMGAWKARLGLEPISVDNKDFKRVVDLVNEKKQIITPESKIQSTQKKLDKRNFVEKILKRYENEWKNTPINKVISSDMFIPKEMLK